MSVNFTSTSTLVNTGTFDSGGASSPQMILDGSTAEKAAPSANYLKFKCNITTNGMYYLNPGGLGAAQFYCDFSFESSRAWVMVIANRINTGGMNNLTYANATGAVVNTRGTYDANLAFNLWVGLDYWPYLGNTVCQYVNSNATNLSGTHQHRARWKFSGWGSSYSFLYPRGISVDSGGTTPDWYSYHAVNGFNLSTYNVANGNACNCSASYNNNPWWYGCCWSGNYFAGGGYQDGPYWTSSGGDYYNYGAAFLTFTDT